MIKKVWGIIKSSKTARISFMIVFVVACYFANRYADYKDKYLRSEVQKVAYKNQNQDLKKKIKKLDKSIETLESVTTYGPDGKPVEKREKKIIKRNIETSESSSKKLEVKLPGCLAKPFELGGGYDWGLRGPYVRLEYCVGDTLAFEGSCSLNFDNGLDYTLRLGASLRFSLGSM